MTLLQVKILLRSYVNLFLVRFILSIFFAFSSQSFAIDILTTARSFANQSYDRRVGIEVEFSGLTLKKSLEVISQFTDGKVTKREKKIYTTLKEKTSKGLIYNEAFIPEWLIDTKDFGRLILLSLSICRCDRSCKSVSMGLEGFWFGSLCSRSQVRRWAGSMSLRSKGSRSYSWSVASDESSGD